MPKNKSSKTVSVSEEILCVVEDWALKNCNISEDAAEIVSKRIQRVTKEIQSRWSERDRRIRSVKKFRKYKAPTYRSTHAGPAHVHFTPEENRL